MHKFSNTIVSNWWNANFDLESVLLQDRSLHCSKLDFLNGLGWQIR